MFNLYDEKQRRQAEFLVHKQVELDLFHGIGVYNQNMKEKVENILREKQSDLHVVIRPKFYY
ncbi:DarT ssDNA thymidine ADP-ribosyltransferase family protein [Salinicoccus sp. HZC-1]|uniref:DarT ssDNA thymidine ADP-ribosyltransferase family protein n=1 Tax=Salinicoccus sp. HZC-1 TaxID=3385497 RepID=UPI00398AD5C5